MSKLIRIIAIIGGVFSIAVVVMVGDLSDLSMIALAVAFAIWTVAPYGLIYARAPEFEQPRLRGALLLLAAVAAVVFAVSVYWAVFFNNPKPDAQDGLVFIFVPLYQLIGIWIVLAVGRWISINDPT